MLPVGTVLKGTYRIERFLSSGGFGNTYVAVHVGFDKIVAVKEFFMKGVTHRETDGVTVEISNNENRAVFGEQLKKFRKEALRLWKLNNRHIVSVHGLFDANGTAYYVMDYIGGESLAALLKRIDHPLPENEVMGILSQILDALGFVHHQGLLHLDLKPANIMLDEGGRVRLIDFGASKQLSPRGGASSTSAITYTKGFAPREQMEQNTEKFGPWTDLYALGATLYCLLTNKKSPLPSDIDDDGTKDKHVALPFPKGVSAQTRQLVLKLMSTNRLRRPQSVEEVLDEFGTICGMEVANEDSEETETLVLDKKKDNNPDETIQVTKELKKEAPSNVWRKVSFLLANTRRTLRRGFNMVLVLAVLSIAVLVTIKFCRGGLNKDVTASVTPKVSVQDSLRAVLDSIPMVFVEGGTFNMGRTENIDVLDWDRLHKVTLSDYYIGKTEVTQDQWMAVMGKNPSRFKGGNLPVENVTYTDVISFLGKLNQMTGKNYRLPTESEWEYAAIGGNKSKGYIFSGSNDVGEVAWYKSNSNSSTHPVAAKAPNALGIYDMSGNVNEWCSDLYLTYPSTPQVNPKGGVQDHEEYRHIIRGGGWNNHQNACENTCRTDGGAESKKHDALGLRLVCDAEKSSNNNTKQE